MRHRRYGLAAMAIVPAVVALLLIASARQGGLSPSAQTGQTGAELVATPGGMAQVAPPAEATQVVAEEMATRAALPPVSRQAAAELGRFRAGAFGEDNPTLIDATVLTLDEALRKVHPEGGPIDRPVGGHAVVRDDAQVWLVRMEGTFQPPRHPPGRSPPWTVGWMYTIVDVETGRTVTSGINSNAMPVR